jgi:hypothetical protein
MARHRQLGRRRGAALAKQPSYSVLSALRLAPGLISLRLRAAALFLNPYVLLEKRKENHLMQAKRWMARCAGKLWRVLQTALRWQQAGGGSAAANNKYLRRLA